MWCTAYNKETDRMMVIFPEKLIKDKVNAKNELIFDIFPSSDSFKNYLNDKYKVAEGDIFSFPFVTKDYPTELLTEE